MLKKYQQMEMSMSPYLNLYDILIKKDNFWRQLKEHIDFGFIREVLAKKYSDRMGRTAEDVERMFKFLLIKSKDKLSDRDLVEKARTNLEYKYFLGYDPEETNIISASTLTKFRTLRIGTEKDAESILNLLIRETIRIAIREGIIKRASEVIVDATHSKARYGKLSPREELQRQAKEIRKEIYKINAGMKEKMPAKRETGILEDQIKYTEELIKAVEDYREIPGIKEKINYLEETKEDIERMLKENIEERKIQYGKDVDAREGHKTADTSFFGYKTHLAMTPEFIITGAVITSGEKTDGKQLKELIEASEENGIEVKAVIGDGAYSEKNNIEMCKEKNIKLVSKLNKMILEGHTNRHLDEYEYNKDADMYVCKAGEMAIRKSKDKCGSKNRDVIRYYFDVEKCKICPKREGCYKEGSKKKSLTVTIKSEAHKSQANYMESEEFKELYKKRYKIEIKNSELKNIGDMKSAYGCGKRCMTIQGASTLFLANFKRILTIKEEKEKEKKKK